MLKRTFELLDTDQNKDDQKLESQGEEPLIKTLVRPIEPTFGWFVTFDPKVGKYVPCSVVNSPDGSRFTSPVVSPRANQEAKYDTTTMFSTLKRSETRTVLFGAVEKQLQQSASVGDLRSGTPVLVQG